MANETSNDIGGWTGKEDIRTTTADAVSPQLKLFQPKREWKLGDYAWRPEYDCSELQTFLEGMETAAVGPIKLITRDIVKTILQPNVNIATTPRLHIYEFEPKVGFFMLMDLFKAIKEIADEVWDTKESGVQGIFERIKTNFGRENIQNTLREVLTGVSEGNFLFKSAPEAFYARIISGTWLNYFELPYYGNEFLHGKGHSGWTSTDVRERFLTGGISEILDRFGLGAVNVPWIPQFKVSGIGEPADEIACTFYLNNYKIDDFIKNFRFLLSLVSGSFWMQEGLLQRGSNFYQVYIPGRMKYYLCTADMKVECCGKSRNIQMLTRSRLANEGFPTPFTNYTWVSSGQDSIKSSNDQLTLIPDGYKVTITFQSIIPNTFNAVMFGLENKDLYANPDYTNKAKVEHWGVDFMYKLRDTIKKPT